MKMRGQENGKWEVEVQEGGTQQRKGTWRELAERKQNDMVSPCSALTAGAQPPLGQRKRSFSGILERGQAGLRGSGF